MAKSRTTRRRSEPAESRKPRRFELSDSQWALIEPLLPKQGRGGRWNDHRATLDGMLWILRTGSPWRDLPNRYGAWKSVYARFRRWTDDGTFDKILRQLRIRLDKDKRIGWDVWCIDGSNIRAHKAAAGGGKKGANQSHPTTHWVAREADGEQSSTWLLVVEESLSPRQ